MKLITILLLATCIVYSKQESGEEGNLFEGDVILSPDQMKAMQEQDSKKSQFAAMKSNHWKTNGRNDVIKYFISDLLSQQNQAVQAIRDAIADYHKYTCIRFQRVYSKPTGPHIEFIKSRGCFSYVGKRSQGNQISLGSGCWYKGTAMHEIGHALGFFHEQSRPDRDNYVKIVTENIKPANLHNFNAYKTDRIDSLGSPYDYRSMMHYGKGYFAKTRGLITIQTIDPKYQDVIGQRNGFSTGDIEQFNKMYNCVSVGTSKPQTPTTTRRPVITTTTRSVTTTRRRPVTTTKQPTGGECKNEWSYCERISKDYICNNFADRCKKRCGLCKPSSTTTRRPVTTTTTSRPITTTKQPTGGQCENEWSCSATSKDFYCGKYSHKCRKLCGLCGSATSRPSCGKDHDGCSTYWKNMCDNGYIKKQCPKHCNVC